jgi:uncharacterized protein (TIGR02117 family)
MVAISYRAHNPCYPAVMVRSPRRTEARAAVIRIIACLGLSTGMLAASGCAEIPAAPSHAPALAHRAIPSTLAVGVLVAGWHTGLVLPAGELGPLQVLLRRDPQARYVSFGWGNRRFYMASQPRSGDALAALFRSPSALFVQTGAAPAELSASEAHIDWICASAEQLWRMDRYIEQSLSRPERPVDLGPGPLPGNRFYAAAGHYSAVHTCNTWTVAALQYAGLPVRAGGVLFASQVDGRISGLRACPAPQ